MSQIWFMFNKLKIKGSSCRLEYKNLSLFFSAAQVKEKENF